MTIYVDDPDSFERSLIADTARHKRTLHPGRTGHALAGTPPVIFSDQELLPADTGVLPESVMLAQFCRKVLAPTALLFPAYRRFGGPTECDRSSINPDDVPQRSLPNQVGVAGLAASAGTGT